MVESAPTRRLFFALWPDAAVRSEIIRQFEQMPQFGMQAHNMQPNNLHLTLHFMGNVAADQAGCIQRAAQTIRVAAFDVQLDTVGYFRQPKIFWMGCSDMSAGMQALHQQLADALLPCDYRAESRPFTPHVTLLRKLSEPGEFIAFKSILWSVKAFSLIESLPSSDDVIYRPLENYFLLSA